MGRKNELPLLEKVRITDIGAEGNAIARIDNQVVFVPMLIPGDIVDIKINKKRKKYMEGSVVRFHEYSPDRIKPRCRHFGVCGGCRWQHLPYHLQLYYKEKQVKDNLTRIGKADIGEINPIIGSPEIFLYRNKLEYTFSEKRWLTREEIISDNDFIKEDALGFHIPGLFDKVLDIRECYLQPEPSNAIRDAVRRFAHKKSFPFYNPRQQSGFLRNLIIRNTSDGNVMVIVVFFLDEKKRIYDLMDFLGSEFPAISSLMYIINTKRNDSLADQEPVLYKGEDHLLEEMEGLKFRIGPKSFYQTNTKQSLRLYNAAKDFAGLTGNEVVYDLYTGTGTIANFIAESARTVIGIEYIEEAIRDAVINSDINNIKNTRFFAGDIKSVLNDQFIASHGRPDVIITDPPRAGMQKEVVRSIISAGPEKIVYISCNPATQARDIEIMSEYYRITKIQPVDMFPQTHHVENVVLMQKIVV
ncbi:MAG: 23S rRNA (uracil-5-)-methyltransferase RumA [Bacteroidetes bacterium RBG_19FT_COMBO_42_7]|nr:MAG: 23S rRNA (uracil-5-)-methyltransferase RumA [Bacteroidetes bacterium RBG_19FT_COMBO_42_7]